MSYTPRPWEAVCSEGVWHIQARDGRDHVSFFCAYGRGQGHPDLIAEATANAKLIAAAPDLLAALTEATEWNWIDGDVPQDVQDLVSAAIAKATNEDRRS